MSDALTRYAVDPTETCALGGRRRNLGPPLAKVSRDVCCQMGNDDTYTRARREAKKPPKPTNDENGNGVLLCALLFILMKSSGVAASAVVLLFPLCVVLPCACVVDSHSVTIDVK